MTQQSNKTSYVLPAILAFGPILLLACSFLAYATTKIIAPDTSNTEANLFGEQPSLEPALNILVYIFGAAGFVTLFPGIIVGSIIYVKRKNRRNNYY
ncbi:MAG: hypothetical protein PVI21_02675 [Candidatus Woesebacteria bacterium]|jgi:hypothetical protein